MSIHKKLTQLNNSTTYLLAFALLTLGTVVAQTWYAAYEDRQQTLQAERQHGLVAVRLLEENASQTLQDAAHRIDGVIDRLAQEDLSTGVTRAALNRAAQGSERDAKTLPALQFVAPSGQSWVTSLDYAAFQVDQDSRSYINYLREQLKLNAIVVAASFTRFYDGKTVLPLARNLHDAQGHYLGLISTDIDVSYFKQLYERVALQNHAMVALVSNHGFIVMRSPSSGAAPDNSTLAQDPRLAQLARGGPEGSFEDAGFLTPQDGRPRMYAYRKLANFAFIAVYARTMDDILAAWRARTVDRTIYSAVFIVIHLALSYLLLRHIRRRKVAELHLGNSERKFSSMFKLSPLPMAVLNMNCRCFVDANHAMLKQFRHTSGVLRGSDFYREAWWRDKQAQQTFEESLARDGAVKAMEAQLLRQDGAVLTCQLSGGIFEVDGERMAIIAALDISAERAMERRMHDLNAQLRQQVATDSDQLHAHRTNLSKLQLELIRAERMAALGALVAGVAHEMNTPLGNCITVSTALEEDLHHTSQLVAGGTVRRSELTQFFERAERGQHLLSRNLQRAGELIASFKQVAVDQDSEHRRTFEVAPWLRELLLTLTPMYKNTPFQLNGEAEPGLLMDSFPGALGQVVVNLINNSLMHGFEGRSQGVMCLTVWSHPPDQLQLIYSDNGRGISPEHLARVCDPFFTTKLGQGGSGLGMHIVYNLVTNLLGGELALESPDGKGVKIIITLPLRAPQRGAQASPLALYGSQPTSTAGLPPPLAAAS